MKTASVLAAVLTLACLVPAALGQVVPLPEFDTPEGFPCGIMSTPPAPGDPPVAGILHVGLRLVAPSAPLSALVQADLQKLSRGCAQVAFKPARPIDLGSGRTAVVFHAIAPETVGVATVAYFLKDGHLARVAKRTASEVHHWVTYRHFRRVVVDFAAESKDWTGGAGTEI